MTIYEEVYYNTPDLSKFYRFEGFNSYPYFQFQEDTYLTNILNYIYFSGSEKHHMYYVTKRLKQLISELTSKNVGCQFNKAALLDPLSFNEIEKYIENYSFGDKLLSIEFSVSNLINEMLYKNTINNRRKILNDRRIEKVDSHIKGGGYGFCDEWLSVFNLLTFFYSYQRITYDNILDFLHVYRRNLIESKEILNPTAFLLNPKNRVIKLNNKICCDFSKYELMDLLQKIVEQQNYFPNSIFSEDSNKQIKRIVQEYNLERERILELSDSVYQKTLKM